MSSSPSARSRALTCAFVVPLMGAIGLALACAPTPRANGEVCIKDQDCLSGVCAGGACAPQPTLLDAEVNGPGVDASTVKEAAVDAPEEASDEGGDDGGGEAASEGGGDAGDASDGPSGDGASDSGDSGKKDTGADAKKD